jgi:hypothetical protein
MMTSERLNPPMQISWLEDSPVKTLALQDGAPAWLARVRGYGPKCLELFARFDPDTQLWKTSQRCLIEGYQTWSQTWPRSGLIRNGIAYRLAPLVPLTDVTECGLWPTPIARDARSRKGARRSKNAQGSEPLSVQVWATPTVHGNYNRKGASATSGDGQAGGALNPTWVEWLMGYPAGWTDLEV